MPLSTDVIVRKETVIFPRKCVVCGKPVEDEVVKLRGNPVGLYGVISWLFGRSGKLEVPAHMGCGSKLSRSMAIRNLSLILGVAIVAILALSLGLTKWQAVGVISVVIAAPIVWQVIRPLAFEFTHHSDHFKLMFLDPAAAREIAELNEGELEDDEGEADEK